MVEDEEVGRKKGSKGTTDTKIHPPSLVGKVGIIKCIRDVRGKLTLPYTISSIWLA